MGSIRDSIILGFGSGEDAAKMLEFVERVASFDSLEEASDYMEAHRDDGYPGGCALTMAQQRDSGRWVVFLSKLKEESSAGKARRTGKRGLKKKGRPG